MNPLYNQFSQPDEISQIRNEAFKLKQQVPNPRAEVEKLLQTGQMSQQQFNHFMQIANNLTRYM